MRRPPRVPAQLPQQLPHRPVVRNGVADGLEALEPKPPLLVAHHDAPLARALAPGVLHVVVPRAVRLPNVHLDAGHRPPPRVLDRAHGQHRLPRRVRRHGAPVGQHRRVVRVKGPEHGALGAERRFGVVDVVDEERQAKDVGEEDEFLRCRGGWSVTAEAALGGRGDHTLRTSFEMCPHAMRKPMAAIHSSVLRRVSRAKSWRWVTRRAIR